MNDADANLARISETVSYEEAVYVTDMMSTEHADIPVGGTAVNIPREEWGVGMSDKTIRTGLCPGGRPRLGRLLRLLETERVDLTPMSTHRFPFEETDEAFRLMESKEEDIIKPLIDFE
nr:hypothetical protein [Halomicroarcula nitratireducens]